MAIKFSKINDNLILSYERKNLDWLTYKLARDEKVKIQKTFTFTKDDLYGVDLENLEDSDFTVLDFIFGKKENDYFRISERILSTNLPVFIHSSIELETKSFISAENISIFTRINNLVKNPIYIGGSHTNAIPPEEFSKLIDNFPNTYEQRKYADAIVSSMLRNYFDNVVDAETKYHKYLNKKNRKVGSNLLQTLKDQEKHKYEIMLTKLEDMLAKEEEYTENQWQKEILQIILLFYPKYIQAFTEVKVRDVYNGKNRKLDFMLLDTSGNVDIIEIKKPFNNAIMTQGKYRDNHIPLRDLSGTIMQIEKYIFYLNKWGKKGENELTKKYSTHIPNGMNIKITNPSALIIMGRYNNLSQSQRCDFEIVKRKYKNILDIITYDDLVSRLKFVVEQWTKT